MNINITDIDTKEVSQRFGQDHEIILFVFMLLNDGYSIDYVIDKLEMKQIPLTVNLMASAGYMLGLIQCSNYFDCLLKEILTPKPN